MRAPACHQNPLDPRPATSARKPRPLVHAVLQLKESLHSVCIHIVAHRRASQLNRVRQHCPQGQPQAFQLLPRQLPCSSAWHYARLEQALVGVDVSHSTQQLLVQQSRLDGQLSPPEQLPKLRRSNRHRLTARGAESLHLLQLAKLQPPEPSRIHKPDLPPARQAHPRMRMRRNRPIWGRHQ